MEHEETARITVYEAPRGHMGAAHPAITLESKHAIPIDIAVGCPFPAVVIAPHLDLLPEPFRQRLSLPSTGISMT